MESDLEVRARAASRDEEPLSAISGFVGDARDVAGLPPRELYKVFGLNYDDHTFTPDGDSMFAVRYRNGDALSTADYTTHIDPVVPSRSLRAMETMPDEYFAIADDAERAAKIQEWIEEVDAIEAKHGSPRALDPINPFRGNGFGGTGSDYAPEFSYAGASVQVSDGAELWRIRPDGSQEVAAVYRDGAWNVVAGDPDKVP
jgi:hypothetical protein